MAKQILQVTDVDESTATRLHYIEQLKKTIANLEKEYQALTDTAQDDRNWMQDRAWCADQAVIARRRIVELRAELLSMAGVA